MAMDSHLHIDRYVVETLMPDLVGHDHHPSAFLVYLALTAAPASPLSYSQLAELTGLSKRAVQDAVARLKRRELIETTSAGPTEPPRYRVLTPWRGR